MVKGQISALAFSPVAMMTRDSAGEKKFMLNEIDLFRQDIQRTCDFWEKYSGSKPEMIENPKLSISELER